jgi:hypothetical protein
MQWLAAVWLYHDRGTELKSCRKIFRDWIRLNHMDHVFLQGPRFERMRRRSGAEFRGLASFAVKNTIVRSEAALFDDRRCRDDLLAGGAGSADLSDIFIAFKRCIEEFAINRRWFFAYGEGPVNLRRIAPVADSELG